MKHLNTTKNIINHPTKCREMKTINIEFVDGSKLHVDDEMGARQCTSKHGQVAHKLFIESSVYESALEQVGFIGCYMMDNPDKIKSVSFQ